MILAIVLWNFRKSSSDKSDNKVKKIKKMPYEKRSNGCEKKVETEKKKVEENGEASSDIPKLKWVKVGRVEELYYYPLKSGRGKAVTECKFTEFGISIEKDGLFTLRDRYLKYNIKSI